MASSSCFCFHQFSHKIDCSVLAIRPPCNISIDPRITFALKGKNTELFGHRVSSSGSERSHDWSFMRGSGNIIRTNSARSFYRRKSSGIYASWLTSSQIASGTFTCGTLAVLPFYTLMVLAPKAELTKKTMQSYVPFVALGLLNAYVLYLSWTPDTIPLVFGGKYWLPQVYIRKTPHFSVFSCFCSFYVFMQLPSIAKLFSGEMTIASVWIHLLTIDLFAARQVFNDGLEKGIETRHSVSLCMFSSPLGILTHVITKALTTRFQNANATRGV